MLFRSRTVALITGADTIRDVIAFPKTASGGDPLTGAPAPITAEQRKEAGVDFVPKAKSAASPENAADAASAANVESE